MLAAGVIVAFDAAADIVAVYSCKGMDEIGDALQPALRRFPFDFHGLVANKRQAATIGKAQVAPVVDEPGIRRSNGRPLFKQALQFGRFEVAEIGEGFFAVMVGFVVHQRTQPLLVSRESVVEIRQGQGVHLTGKVR